MTTRRSPVAALAALALIAFSAPTADAGRGRIPVIEQITNLTVGDIESPRVRMEKANWITFMSRGDVLGAGTSTTANEVYVYNRLTGTITRVTNTLVGDNWNASRVTDGGFNHFTGGRPELLTFTSTGEHGPNSSNPEGNPEIFLYEIESGTFHQLTDTGVGVVNDQAYPSDTSKCIVFQSTGELDNNPGTENNFPPTGHSNADGSAEIFMYLVQNASDFPNTGFFLQLTNGPAGTTSHSPTTGGYVWARQCGNTPFLSDHDHTGAGVTTEHLYIFKRNGYEIIRTADRGGDRSGLTPSAEGNYTFSQISSASQFARGPNVVFTTDADIWNTESTGQEMFIYRVFHPTLRQATHIPSGDIFTPSISDGGGWIAYGSTGELLSPRRGSKAGEDGPFNADGNQEIFQNRTRRIVWQITRTEGCENTNPTQNGSGEWIGFRSDCDLVPGSNPTSTPQLFLYSKVGSRDDLASATACLVADGCCNEANGCFVATQGAQRRVKRNKPPRPDPR